MLETYWYRQSDRPSLVRNSYYQQFFNNYWENIFLDRVVCLGDPFSHLCGGDI